MESEDLYIREINYYLDQEYKKGDLRKDLYLKAKSNVVPTINKWLNDKNINKISPNTKAGIEEALKQKRWEDLIYAFFDDIAFGTGGIRGLAAFNEKELLKFAKEGIDAKILKGPNTINDIVFLIKSAGVADYAAKKGLKKVIIGYDSRINGEKFATLIAKTFLARGLTVYLFDEACPFPELTFAVPYLKADIGILISASHNDKRYNGYKITSNTGAQLDIRERNYIYENFIRNVSTDEIRLKDISDNVDSNELFFLGGKEYLKNKKYYNKQLINIHDKHLNHIKNFLDYSLLKRFAPKISIAYSAFHGSGRKAVPRLLRDLHFTNTKIIKSLDKLDGMFPCFLLEQQPDPGDPIAAEIAVEEFKKEYGEDSFKNLDILIGTDPDADRTGIIIKIPPEQQDAFRLISTIPPHIKVPRRKKRTDFSWTLLDADTAWTLLLWYQIEKKKINNNGKLPYPEKEFIVLSHTTTDGLVKLAQKYGIGVIKTWVGFAMLADATDMVWKGKNITKELKDWNTTHAIKSHPVIYNTIDMDGKPRTINIGAFEQSNGYSILGGPPSPGERLGKNGHVRDKDGTFAAILLAELAAYAKSQGTTIFNLIDEKIYLDPDIGLFINYYEPVPYWGQFEGLTGISKKIDILKKVDNLRKRVNDGETISIGGKKVLTTEIYRTGKYDEIHYWKGFPDEGIRFFFDRNQLNHITIRPSGTSQCLRFHVQIKVENVTRENLIDKKIENYKLAKSIVAEMRRLLNIKE